MNVTLLQGDAKEVLATLPERSVHCAICSPPYYALRDYGTAQWEGGDPGCTHRAGNLVSAKSGLRQDGREHQGPYAGEKAVTTGMPFRHICSKCGARRQDGQLGLESTPQEYVAALVDVFRGVRRVLREDGTLWCVIGDCYGLDKQLRGMPWRLAFALQDDGWVLRQEICWHKSNPLPESVRDRCTRAHETVFMLAKAPRYYYDQDAIREQLSAKSQSCLRSATGWTYTDGRKRAHERNDGCRFTDGAAIVSMLNPAGRNRRSVWTIATSPLSSKKFGCTTEHYAAFPAELVRPMIRASTSARGVCGACGAPYRRLVARQGMVMRRSGRREAMGEYGRYQSSGTMIAPARSTTTGWQPTCSCGPDAPVEPATVLDCFCGSGTTGLVAVQEGRRFIGIDLNSAYVDLATRRIATAQPPLPVARAQRA